MSSPHYIMKWTERRDICGINFSWDIALYYLLFNSNIATKDDTISTKNDEVTSTCHFDLTSESLICYDVVSGARAPQNKIILGGNA